MVRTKQRAQAYAVTPALGAPDFNWRPAKATYSQDGRFRCSRGV